ncbi:MAG: DUF72 domain-containing protein [Nitrososphaerales archaeon]
MTQETYIGTGGWAYYPVPRGRNKLYEYSKKFNFVEVNFTATEIPDFEQVASWRKTVHDDFSFSVKCNQAVVASLRSNKVDDALLVYETMLDICKILGAKIMVIQTFPDFQFKLDFMKNMDQFLNGAYLDDVKLAWEVKGASHFAKNFVELIQEYNVIHAADISLLMPIYESDVLYTRLHGKLKGRLHHLNDHELEIVAHKIANSKARKVHVAGHTVSMYEDSERLKEILKNYSLEQTKTA